jgi:hypothetical protein
MGRVANGFGMHHVPGTWLSEEWCGSIARLGHMQGAAVSTLFAVDDISVGKQNELQISEWQAHAESCTTNSLQFFACSPTLYRHDFILWWV